MSTHLEVLKHSILCLEKITFLRAFCLFDIFSNGIFQIGNIVVGTRMNHVLIVVVIVVVAVVVVFVYFENIFLLHILF